MLYSYHSKFYITLICICKFDLKLYNIIYNYNNINYFRLGLLLLVGPVLSFIEQKIEPLTEFHEKGKSLIVKCDATSDFKTPLLMYNYKKSNYTLDRIENSNKYVYVGNLTITNPDQFKVNVLCINSVNSEFISSKIYFFGCKYISFFM